MDDIVLNSDGNIVFIAVSLAGFLVSRSWPDRRRPLRRWAKAVSPTTTCR